MPALKRFQQSGTCNTCDGATRFYPARVTDDQALAESADDVETTGEWVHLNPGDWVRNPHPVSIT